MKRVLGSDSSNSMGALMSICPNSTDEGGNNNPGGGGVYSREFQAMMEDDDMNCMDGESCQGLQQLLGGSEKKRRLSVDQVKALEKNFEVENKLEPERKVKLAQELGLQPRQVAVWFQNRRARWKTKQLERDYGLLKATYDALKLDFDNLRHHNDALIKEIRELKLKAKEEYGKDDELMSDTELETSKQNAKEEDEEEEEALVLMKKSAQIKDPSSSDSCDSSAILNEDVNLGDGINIVKNDDVNFRFQESKVVVVASAEDYNHQQQQEQLVKIEEHNFFGEESCSTLFSDDQAPTLHWYEWS